MSTGGTGHCRDYREETLLCLLGERRAMLCLLGELGTGITMGMRHCCDKREKEGNSLSTGGTGHCSDCWEKENTVVSTGGIGHCYYYG